MKQGCLKPKRPRISCVNQDIAAEVRNYNAGETHEIPQLTADAFVANIFRIPRIVSSKDRNSECSPRFEALFLTRGGPFRLLLPLLCSPSSASPGEGLSGGLLEGSCGWRMRSSMPNRLNVGMWARLLLPFQNTKML